jgi:hypothetical protein
MEGKERRRTKGKGGKKYSPVTTRLINGAKKSERKVNATAQQRYAERNVTEIVRFSCQSGHRCVMHRERDDRIARASLSRLC